MHAIVGCDRGGLRRHTWQDCMRTKVFPPMETSHLRFAKGDVDGECRYQKNYLSKQNILFLAWETLISSATAMHIMQTFAVPSDQARLV